MKKNYFEPAVETVEIEIENVMQVVSGETTTEGTGEGNVGDETPDLAGRGNGNWGNLWKK